MRRGARVISFRAAVSERKKNSDTVSSAAVLWGGVAFLCVRVCVWYDAVLRIRVQVYRCSGDARVGQCLCDMLRGATLVDQFKPFPFSPSIAHVLMPCVKELVGLCVHPMRLWL